MNSNQDKMHDLMHQWASHLGYYNGKIDLRITDLSAFTTKECSLLAHAPLWGTKPGQEKPIPAAQVRRNLAKSLRWAKAIRHQMHIAKHPDKNELGLFFVVKIRPIFLPFNIMTVPLAFVVTAEETSDGLRISKIEEWPADTPAAARQVLIEKCGWPSLLAMTPSLVFGAVS